MKDLYLEILEVSVEVFHFKENEFLEKMSY